MKILIVEDDFTSMVLMKKLMQPYGECVLVSDGMKAAEMIHHHLKEEGHFDLITLDIMLPKMDGQKILKVIRALEQTQNIPEEKRTKVIMTTALSGSNDVLNAMKSGCDAYLVKPIDRNKLREQMTAFGFSESV